VTASEAVRALSRSDSGAIIEVMAEAFCDYPVMRFVLGADAPAFEQRLVTLVKMFVMARVLRDEQLFGVGRRRLVGAALVSRPGRPNPPAFTELREATWSALGSGARARYDACGATWATLQVDIPHIHLNMIGVRDEARGQGVGRHLLERVHALSAGDPTSKGVTLTTENPDNVPFYERFGYRVVGEARIGPGLETWSFFRPDESTR
jgi:GNAT superfamily N-acetyltransferase